MISLEEIKESENFDLRFNNRLNERLLAMEKSNRLVIYAEDIIGGIRESLSPKVPALARAFAIILIFLTIGISSFYYFEKGNPVVTFAKGNVSIYDARSEKWVRAGVDLKLKKGSILKTQGPSYVDISLENKYALRLKDNGEIRIAGLTPRFRKGTVLYELKDGKLFVNIDNGFKGSEFKVTTPQANLTALGTKFMVDTSDSKKEKTWLGVLEGRVKARSKEVLPKYATRPQEVIVEGGKKTEIFSKRPPDIPKALEDKEWEALQELYQIGRKPQVALLISDSPDRVRELLRPCPIFISDKKPREIPFILEETLLMIDKAIKDKDRTKHIEAIKKLEEIVEKYPNPKYDVQFLLFIGVYYEYVDLHDEAIKAFEKLIERYPHSLLASLAKCAIGVIYDESIKDKAKAEEIYRYILIKYKNSPEYIFAENRLGKK